MKMIGYVRSKFYEFFCDLFVNENNFVGIFVFDVVLCFFNRVMINFFEGLNEVFLIDIVFSFNLFENLDFFFVFDVEEFNIFEIEFVDIFFGIVFFEEMDV